MKKKKKKGDKIPAHLVNFFSEFPAAIKLDGCHEFIIGRDFETNSIIYDGYGIINHLTNLRVKDEGIDENDEDTWADYYDEVLHSLLNQVEGIRRNNHSEDTPAPIISMAVLEVE